MKNEILSHITTECPWRDTLYWYDTIDSTNTRAKEMAKNGAPHGTVLIAGNQTVGRGRLGRSFSSPDGMGVYLSVLLRPDCTPDKLMHLTCAAAVAGCEAVKDACGIRPRIKWTNDLVYKKKKLGGILTELSVTDGIVEYAIVGIGINCLQKKEDFPSELQEIATSLKMICDTPCSPARLAATLTEALCRMDNGLFSAKNAIMDRYRSDCMTVGQDIVVVQGENVRYGKALYVDDEGGLSVLFSDGSKKIISSGEVSVRGMYGYV